MINRAPEAPVKREARASALEPRSSVYYVPRPLPERDVRLTRRIDAPHLELPFYGSRKLADRLQREGHDVGRRYMATLMRRMGIEAQYRRLRTSLPARDAAIYRYVPSGLAIGRPNQVGVSDMTASADGARLHVLGCDPRRREPQGPLLPGARAP
jgi:putative transposase